MNYQQTTIWKRTLGVQGNEDIDRLRVAYLSLRTNMQGLQAEISKDFPQLTVHSVEHSDSLWRVASLLAGDNYPINPLEAFILGCSFLIHDSILSYKAFGGKSTLRNTIEWKDQYQEIAGTEFDNEEGKGVVDFKVLRRLHAKECVEFLLKPFSVSDGFVFNLLSDDELRTHYGLLIGQIASSHHWESSRLLDFQTQVNPLAFMPQEWIINPIKLACLLRCADAAAIDSGRAPDNLFRLLSLNGVSHDHWVAQNRLGIALCYSDSSSLVVTSTHAFEENDFSAWNVAYDAVKVIESELDISQSLLPYQEQLRVKHVAGAKSRLSLSKYIRTRNWQPSDVNVHISDVSKLISTLGGKELYGKEDHHLIVLRELIQNARDAIKARQLLERDGAFEGRIDIEVKRAERGCEVIVTDNGVGMSLETVSQSLLNFGKSFWHSDDVLTEFPGLKSAGFNPIGKYGIGFFSVFLIAKSVMVETRRYTDGIRDAFLLKFPKGITLSPILAKHVSSTSYTTRIVLDLDTDHLEWPYNYTVKRNLMGASDFIVPFYAMLSTLVIGLDVDVYYKEGDNNSVRIHRRIDASDLNGKEWLRALSFADFQKNTVLDNYIENNYSRLQLIYDEHQQIVGYAALGTRLNPGQDFLGASTVGGLISSFHSRSGEYWIGYLDRFPDSARRYAGEIRASQGMIRNWVYNQIGVLNESAISTPNVRYRVQITMHYLKIDPIDIAIAFCLSGEKHDVVTLSLKELISVLKNDHKLLILDSDFSRGGNEGHADSFFFPSQVDPLLKKDELLFLPRINSSFLSYKLIDRIPEKNFGFIDCLYRTAVLMGEKIVFSYRPSFFRNSLGLIERAIVVQVDNDCSIA